MIDDIINNEQMVVCSYGDAIKVQGVYINAPKETVYTHIEIAERLGYSVSHGICPDCSKRVLEEYRNVRDLQKREVAPDE